MRRLFPDPGDVGPIAAYGRLRRDGHRPRVRLNMIASVDAAGSIDGHSAALVRPADTALFATLRAAADVILVGAATMRIANYGPARPVSTTPASRTTGASSDTESSNVPAAAIRRPR